MSKILYLVSHGICKHETNPSHTEKGFRQIALLQMPAQISRFVVGTGTRFEEVYRTILANRSYDSRINNAPVFYSPFCGSADYLDPPDTIVMANGTKCERGINYIGLDSPHFNPWGFVDSQPDGTLFCSGGVLLYPLGLQAIHQKGRLYELNPEAQTGKMIA